VQDSTQALANVGKRFERADVLKLVSGAARAVPQGCQV
jgi:hypothetical protein